jgi:hypothetical protein
LFVPGPFTCILVGQFLHPVNPLMAKFPRTKCGNSLPAVAAMANFKSNTYVNRMAYPFPPCQLRWGGMFSACEGL